MGHSPPTMQRNAKQFRQRSPRGRVSPPRGSSGRAHNKVSEYYHLRSAPVKNCKRIGARKQFLARDTQFASSTWAASRNDALAAITRYSTSQRFATRPLAVWPFQSIRSTTAIFDAAIGAVLRQCCGSRRRTQLAPHHSFEMLRRRVSSIAVHRRNRDAESSGQQEADEHAENGFVVSAYTVDEHKYPRPREVLSRDARLRTQPASQQRRNLSTH